MFKREIWDKFQKMNEVNFPQIYFTKKHVIPGSSHLTSSQTADNFRRIFCRETYLKTMKS